MQKYLLIFNKILYGLVVGLFVFIPLYPKFPLFKVSGTFAAIRLEDVLIAIAISMWFISILLSGKLKSWLDDKLNLSIVLYLFIGLVSLFSGIFLTQTVQPHLGFLHLLRRVEYMMLLPVVYYIVKSKEDLIRILFVISGVLLLVNLYALGQQYFGWPVISTANSEFAKGQILRLDLATGARVNSTFAGHYDLAVFLAMALVVLSALFFAFKNLLIKCWISVLGILSFTVLVMTAARLSFAAAMLGMIIVLVLLKKWLLILLLLAVCLLSLIYPSQLRDRLIATVQVNLFQGGERYVADQAKQNRHQLNLSTIPGKTDAWNVTGSTISATDSREKAADIVPGEPLDTTELGVYRSAAIRTDVEWPRAIRGFLKNPLLGTGYSSLGLATDNDFLRSLGEVGILGTAAFVLVFIEIVTRLRKQMKFQREARLLSVGVLVMVGAFLLNGVFIDVFEASKIAEIFWMILGLTLAVGKIKEFK